MSHSRPTATRRASSCIRLALSTLASVASACLSLAFSLYTSTLLDDVFHVTSAGLPNPANIQCQEKVERIHAFGV